MSDEEEDYALDLSDLESLELIDEEKGPASVDLDLNKDYSINFLNLLKDLKISKYSSFDLDFDLVSHDERFIEINENLNQLQLRELWDVYCSKVELEGNGADPDIGESQRNENQDPDAQENDPANFKFIIFLKNIDHSGTYKFSKFYTDFNRHANKQSKLNNSLFSQYPSLTKAITINDRKKIYSEFLNSRNLSKSERQKLLEKMTEKYGGDIKALKTSNDFKYMVLLD